MIARRSANYTRANLIAMAPISDSFDLGALRLTAGEGRRLDLTVHLDPFDLGGHTDPADPAEIPVRIDISRTTGDGYSLRLQFTARLAGPCMRCLEPAAPDFTVDAREVSQPGEGEELESPYVDRGVLDVRSWVRDALALALPATVLCRPDCAGLCAVCGENLNLAEAPHVHDSGPDPRWAKLSELRFD
jgi:uncharacterized protein